MSQKSLIHRTSFAVGLALALSISVPVQAQEPDDHRLDEAWMDALEDEEGILTPKQFAMLNNLAYNAAVTRVCDGFELSQDKFSAGLSEAVTPAHEAALSEDDNKEWASSLLISLGMRYGLMIAEGNAQKESFCAAANELKASADVPNYWE